MVLYTRTGGSYCRVTYTDDCTLQFTTVDEAHDFPTMQSFRKADNMPEGMLANIGVSNLITTTLDQDYLLLIPKRGAYAMVAGYVPVGHTPTEISIDEISEEIIAQREGKLLKPHGIEIEFSKENGFFIRESSATLAGLTQKPVYVDGKYCASQSYFDPVTNSAQLVYSYDLHFEYVDTLSAAEETLNTQTGELEANVVGPLLLVALENKKTLRLKNEAYYLQDGSFTKVKNPTLSEPFCPISETISLEDYCKQQ